MLYEHATPAQRQERQNIRNLYFPATDEEMQTGIEMFAAKKNWFAVACILELRSEPWDVANAAEQMISTALASQLEDQTQLRDVNAKKEESHLHQQFFTWSP